ncbi:DNA helicase INO80-like isoform X1 [Carex littledalei]|uniref:Chromatin-remodeling ATPase INO80 n=1 Tax=Carex littledalei TaxID=544730 RepID=A0A833QQK9_9POAL|nr:DNA helicase INO80-like isoform X1 [Carex littledalei]
MDARRQHQANGGLSYSNLFNLESLVNFRVPLPDDIDQYGSSSPDGSEGPGSLSNTYNSASNSFTNSTKRRKRNSFEPENNGDSSDDYNYGITEDHYRSMLTEHVQTYRRSRTVESVTNSDKGRTMPTRKPVPKKSRFSSDKERGSRLHPDYLLATRLASSLDSPYLDLGEGITYRLPPIYGKLAAELKLPSYSDIRVEEFFLKGSLDLRSIAAMVATDKRAEVGNRRGLGQPQTQYESLQARAKAEKFSLQVNLDSFAIPEGAAGRIRRFILTENGTLQAYYVKVLEKGDTYEIIERSLPKKPIVKKDPSVIEREEREKMLKCWAAIARRDIPRHQRIFTNLHKKQMLDAKRFAEASQREVKLKVSRSLKLMRSAPIRTRKLARDMLIFWKRVDKEQAEIKKKEEKEAAEALKREEELREARRQQQRLNFLLSQTELYSHFMQNKANLQPDGEGEPFAMDGDEEAETGEEEDTEESELKKEALRAAQLAVSQQKKITDAFDTECSKLRQASELGSTAIDPAIAESNMDLLNPSTMPVKSTVQTPELFNGTLKEYQLKGLQWLVNCYEQGLNGILADEMGLGKTIQAMAFLAHLAEEKNIWGPFLVVAPSSVLNNWADEVSRFCPDLKTLPYWGGLPERTVLRKNINPKRLYRRDSGFHILITSYQLLVSDEKYLRRVKWQYMVLDEAQAIKSSNSIRWKTLLSFNCRNRLLLTGTPIQNNMAELWALLHFIMPTLFDSHEQFNEWFSKGIESHAEHGGTLNEHQLTRLHAVLKPFMLRRVKKDVITEMTGKIEITVHCKLSSRQQAFYQAIKNKISLVELFDGTRGHLNEKKMINLMNIVMQLRKVCNHPELFERNEGSSYFHFADVSNSLPSPPFGELEDVHYAGAHNPIIYKIPKLVYEEIVHDKVLPCSFSNQGIQRESYKRLLNIFSPDKIYYSTLPLSDCSSHECLESGAFGFTRLVDLSPTEVSFLANSSLLERLSFSIIRWDRHIVDETIEAFIEAEGDHLECSYALEKGKVRAVARMLLMPTKSDAGFLRAKLSTGSLDEPFEALAVSHQERLSSNIRLLRAAYAFIPTVRAPPINAWCSNRNWAYQITEELHHPWTKKLYLGFARTSECNGPKEPTEPHYLIQELDSKLPDSGPLLKLPYRIFGSCPPVQNFDPAKMLTDSGKLQTLDILLRRLRANNHRVLLFAQMTKMLDILEDYMNFRKYKYLRLDGSSAINDRRDMVRDFQTRNDIFVFLLSTRAGGLGINLTAADTVIFYEIDWNPTLDMQAMDRAHRLGQTKEASKAHDSEPIFLLSVTVYRLICKETVEEKILQRANQKNTVQQLVMTGKHVQGDLLKQEDVVSLLLDDNQLEQKLKEISIQAKDRQKKKRERAQKGIRIDEHGENVTLEDFNNNAGADVPEQEKDNQPNKKRRQSTQKKAPKSQDSDDLEPVPADDVINPGTPNEEHYSIALQRPKRLKKPNRNVEEAGTNCTAYDYSGGDNGVGT